MNEFHFYTSMTYFIFVKPMCRKKIVTAQIHTVKRSPNKSNDCITPTNICKEVM